MASPISSALAKLDGSLQALQAQVDALYAGLEINDSQLNYSLADTSQNAAMVRDLIRAERPDAAWGDRGSLERLIRDLEVAAQQRRNEQRRMRLLDLADEFEAGSIRHRSESRTASLNGLRMDAIQQLRADAAVPEQQKELPGPEASEWLHWACNLSEERDGAAINLLRTEFAAVDQFAGEMEETYWTPGERVRRSSAQPPAPLPPRRPEPPAYASKPPAPPSDYGKPSYNVGSRPEPVPQNSNYAAAVARAYDRPSGASPSLASHSQMSSVAVAPEPEILAPPATKYCDKCGATYTDAYHVCPTPEPPPRPAVTPAPAVARPSYPVADKPKAGSNGSSVTPAMPVQAAAPAPVVAAAAPAPAVSKPVVQAPKVEPPKPVAKVQEKVSENKKTRREKRRAAAEAAAAAAAVTAVAVPAAPAPAPAPAPVEVARPKAAAAAPAPAKVAAGSKPESWSTKWEILKTDGGEALKDGNWSKYAFAPESLAAVALLLVVVIGGIMWMSHKGTGTKTPATTVAQNTMPAQTPETAPANATPQATAPATAATQTSKPSDTQSKQDQKSNQDNTTQKETTTPSAQVLSPPPEAPKPSTPVVKEEASAADNAPPSLGAVSGSANGMGSIVKDVSASVPKLANQKLRVSSGVAQGQLLARVNPQYPTAARQERVEGTVVLQAVIAKDGSVQKLTVVSGPNMLTKAAMDAVKQWHYKPFTLNGESVEADTQINVNFKLGD